MNPDTPVNPRILIVDDNPSIHTDFRKILGETRLGSSALEKVEEEIFGPSDRPAESVGYQLASAFQGEEALELVRQAVASAQRFALAFVDVRMPPGWDGVETTARFWQVDPDLNIVICTAYSDYSWDQVAARLGVSDRLVILKKPFDVVEVMQLAESMTRKWNERAQARARLEQLQQELHRSQEQLQKEIEDRQRAERALREAETRLRQGGDS